VTLSSFRGKVVYLDFWYSHCVPCLAEAPAAALLKKQFLGRDVVFLYISIDENAALWQRTMAKHRLASPNSVHLLDQEGWLAARPFHVGSYPSYWIIGRDGRIRQGDAPRPSAGATVVAALEQALAE
jgi:thiol-disulfide isomerase/thioredoxin